MIASTARVGATFDKTVIGFKDPHQQVVGARVIVAIARGLVEQQLALALKTFKISFQHGQHLGHAQVIFLKDMFFYGGETVRDGAHAHPLDVGRVVAWAAGVIILAFQDTVIHQQGEEGRRHVGGIQLFDQVVALDLDVNEGAHLLFEGGIQVFKGSKVGRVTALRTKLLAGTRVQAVVQG